MTPPDWARVRTLFEQALEIDPVARRTWLQTHEADDAVRAEVLSLLASHDTAGAFLDTPLTLEPGGDAIDPGTRVGSYEVVREIGRGGMGCVYLAIDTRLGRQVAIKALPPALAGDAAHSRFRRVAQAAGALMHPGICAVHALEELPEGLFIVTEYMDGETLRAIIARNERPSPSVALDIARQLVGAVAAAHDRGLVHGDIKPENVMRTNDGRIKILDFGLASVQTMHGLATPATGPASATFGTPAYMAPEQIDGARGDARADVFALGVVLYEFASGVHPFAGRSALATVGRIVSADVPPIETLAPAVPPALIRVIASLIVRRIARESMSSSLEALRNRFSSR